MAVQLPNTALGVRRRTLAYDAHGYPMPGADEPAVGPWPGRKTERGDGSWVLALDPQTWPVDERTVVVEPATGAEWTVTEADLLTNNVTPVVDYVRVEAHERVGGHTEP